MGKPYPSRAVDPTGRQFPFTKAMKNAVSVDTELSAFRCGVEWCACNYRWIPIQQRHTLGCVHRLSGLAVSDHLEEVAFRASTPVRGQRSRPRPTKRSKRKIAPHPRKRARESLATPPPPPRRKRALTV